MNHPSPADRAVELARSAWAMPLRTSEKVLVRGARPADLPAVATMHGRCSPQTLLQRYRAGGRGPSLPALTISLAEPLVLAVLAGPREVVALGSADICQDDTWSVEIALVVEDGWQGRGIGTGLARHLAASVRMLGAVQVVTRSASASLPLFRVMQQVGDTRVSQAADHCTLLRTRIQVGTLDGFGGRSRMAEDRRAHRSS